MNAFRLEMRNFVKDTRTLVRLNKLKHLGFKVESVAITDVYTVNKEFNDSEQKSIAKVMTNPIFENAKINESNIETDFDFALEIGFLPGVTDNIAKTTIEAIEDLLKVRFDVPSENVYSSQITFLKGDLTKDDVQKIGESLANPLIQRIHIKSKEEFDKDSGMDVVIPRVIIESEPKADEVDLDISDEELTKLGKQGVPNVDGTRRGPLALSLSYLKTIKAYFEKEGRKPTDIEIESLAQTWSEHCKHTIFADPMDEIKEGIYKHYIKAATNKIRKDKGDKDFCRSVFTDNSGGIVFDDKYLITDKAETHNSPSALDPFGGAITGIVGVNRDCLGFGMGAKPVINRYGYCFGNPQGYIPLYRGKNKTNKSLTPRQIMDGVIAGVNAGGNESGIPSPQGFAYFEDRYRGKPLVFVGTIGLMPQEVNGKPGWEKAAQVGDKVVVIGGRVGLDGVHGATFSSEAMDSGSPATAVQIGDAITQKKLSDAIVKEARDMNLYSSVTDNGAGGISCSVAEMAKECGGCYVELEKVPLKYPNLSPWEIWISESQERMTFSIPEEKLEKFMDLMKSRGVEAVVIGEFNDSGRCKVDFNGETIMDMEMDFLHDGFPVEQITTTYTKKEYDNPAFECPSNLNETVLKMMGRNNIASYEFISMQYDHEVQAGSVIKPLQGKGRVNGSATVVCPIPGNKRGVVLSQGINPRYSDLDTYHMAASAIDTAIRNAVAVGGNVDYMALMDNFCWCSSNEEERLGQLKEAARGCYDSTVAMGTPLISGKDSMFNDFKGFDENGEPIKISVPPTLMVSSIGVIENVEKCITLDPKIAGDLIYVIGETKNELGGSEYFHMYNEIGAEVPKVNVENSLILYRDYYQAIQKNLIASSVSVGFGGLGASLMKMAIASQMGLDVDLQKIANQKVVRDDYLLFSESQSRFVVTIDPNKKDEFEKLIPSANFVGTVTEDPKVILKGLSGEAVVDLSVDELEEAYKDTFRNY